MRNKYLKLTLLAGLLLGGIGLVFAATTGEANKPPAMDHDMAEACQSMMGGGMMQGMMGNMMGGAMMGNGMMPTLPPGNSKLQLQMQAEMLQKVGEIAAKYADKVKEGGKP